jgi:hypothetical protein
MLATELLFFWVDKSCLQAHLEVLVQEQLSHKKRFNVVALLPKPVKFSETIISVTEENLKVRFCLIACFLLIWICSGNVGVVEKRPTCGSERFASSADASVGIGIVSAQHVIREAIDRVFKRNSHVDFTRTAANKRRRGFAGRSALGLRRTAATGMFISSPESCLN